MAVGSCYETEKECGKGKRKKIRNRVFESSDSDEEITNIKRSKKLVPAPPNVPFKHTQEKDIFKKSDEFNSDEEITSTKRSKKLVPAPPNVPSKRTQEKDILQKSDDESNNRFLSKASSHLKVSRMFI